MNQKKVLFFLVVVTALTAVLVVSCASSDPQLGSPTPLQQILNTLPEITIAGKNVKLQFGGDTWIAKESGKNVLAGTFISEDTEGGSTITLKQTHVYSSVGWVKTPGPTIVLEYKEGPPASFSTK